MDDSERLMIECAHNTARLYHRLDAVRGGKAAALFAKDGTWYRDDKALVRSDDGTYPLCADGPASGAKMNRIAKGGNMGMKAWSARVFAGLLVAAGVLGTQPAIAGRANDTLTIAEILPLGGTDVYFGSFPHTQFMSGMLFDTLVEYDPVTRTNVPVLAKSWKENGDTSIDFELRDDVTWHDGKPLTVDDVVYTINWLANPDSKYVNKFRWAWIKGAEKTGPNTVRILTDGRRPYDLLILSLTPIYPAHIRGAKTDVTEFGRKPVGTGPYKLVEYNDAQGRLIVAKNPDYKWGGTIKPVTNIGRIVMRTIPDTGAHVSGLMIGQLDLFRGQPPDQAEALAQDPRFALDTNPNIGVTFMWFDAAGRAGNKALTNPKVREALALSVDRAQLEKIMNANQKIPLPENICWKDRVIGCAYTRTQPGYDPGKARKLLAEAGYPDGFNIRITGFVGRLSQLAEAVAGFYAAIGVKATIDLVNLTAWTKKAQAGEIQMTVGGTSLSGLPDVSQLFAFFYEANDYSGDPRMIELGKAMNAEMDPDKRLAISQQFFDRMAENTYITPLTALPHLFTHTREVEARTVSPYSYGISYSDIRWKDNK